MPWVRSKTAQMASLKYRARYDHPAGKEERFCLAARYDCCHEREAVGVAPARKKTSLGCEADLECHRNELSRHINVLFVARSALRLRPKAVQRYATPNRGRRPFRVKLHGSGIARNVVRRGWRRAAPPSCRGCQRRLHVLHAKASPALATRFAACNTVLLQSSILGAIRNDNAKQTQCAKVSVCASNTDFATEPHRAG